MNTYEITYDGNLKTSALHVDSAEMIHTDAPKDNEGLGESFSPTDLFCTALGSCILTIMAIAARKKGIEIKGTTASVKKTMRSNPRMIDQIDVVIHFDNDFDGYVLALAVSKMSTTMTVVFSLVAASTMLTMNFDVLLFPSFGILFLPTKRKS